MIKYNETSHLNILTNIIVQESYNLSIQSIDVVLQWIPSHRGIVGNTIADEIAKEACYNIKTHLPHSFFRFYYTRAFEERRVHYNRENVSTYICSPQYLNIMTLFFFLDTSYLYQIVRNVIVLTKFLKIFNSF